MKRLLYFLFALVIALICCNDVSAKVQSDSTMNAIKDYTYLTAEHTAKGTYDHWALGISIFAFIVGAITLGFTYLTYSSQKKTEVNTRRWNSTQERIGLRYMLAKLIDNASTLCYLERTRINPIHRGMPSSSVLEDMLLDENELHSEEFFGEGIEYTYLQDLRRKVKVYNTTIKRKACDLQLIDDSYKSVAFYYEDCIRVCYELVKNIVNVYDYMFTYDDWKILKKQIKDSKLKKCPVPPVNDIGLFFFVDSAFKSNKAAEIADCLKPFNSVNDIIQFCNQIKFVTDYPDMNRKYGHSFLEIIPETYRAIDNCVLFPYMLMTMPQLSKYFDGRLPLNNEGIYGDAINRDCIVNGTKPPYVEGIDEYYQDLWNRYDEDEYVKLVKLIDDIFNEYSITKVVLTELLINEVKNVIPQRDILWMPREKRYEGIRQLYTPSNGGCLYVNLEYEDLFLDIVSGKKENQSIALTNRYLNTLFKEDLPQDYLYGDEYENIPLEYVRNLSKIVFTNHNGTLLSSIECEVKIVEVAKHTPEYVIYRPYFLSFDILSVSNYQRIYLP